MRPVLALLLTAALGLTAASAAAAAPSFSYVQALSGGSPNGEYAPQAAIDAQGDAVVAWVQSLPANTSAVYAAYRPAGGVFGPGVALSTPGRGVSFGLAMSAAGASVVVWTVTQGTDLNVELAQRPAGATAAFAPTTPLASYSGGPSFGNPTAAFDPAGDALVAWNAPSPADGIYTSYAPAGGAFGPAAFALRSDVQRVVLLPDGSMVAQLFGVTTATRTGGPDGVWSQLIPGTSTGAGHSEVRDALVASNANGDVAIAFQHRLGFSALSPAEVSAVVRPAATGAMGPEVVASPTVALDRGGEIEPTPAIDAAGDVEVTWLDAGGPRHGRVGPPAARVVSATLAAGASAFSAPVAIEPGFAERIGSSIIDTASSTDAAGTFVAMGNHGGVLEYDVRAGVAAAPGAKQVVPAPGVAGDLSLAENPGGSALVAFRTDAGVVEVASGAPATFPAPHALTLPRGTKGDSGTKSALTVRLFYDEATTVTASATITVHGRAIHLKGAKVTALAGVLGKATLSVPGRSVARVAAALAHGAVSAHVTLRALPTGGRAATVTRRTIKLHR